MSKNIITIKNIEKNFKHKKVLNKVSFSVKKNECIALVGKNGAGKSTLLNIILGKYYQNMGSINIDCDKKNIGFLPQKTNFPDDVKVHELIDFVSSYSEDPLSRKEVGLILNFSNEQMNQFASKLSGGQQRLLDFCLSVVNKPQLLIVDEPTASMDTSTRHHFWECIKRLKGQETTILFTTHYLEEVNYCSDRVILLDDGNLIADEPPYRLRMLNHEKIIRFTSTLYNKFEQQLITILKDNQVKVTNSEPTVEIHFVEEKTNNLIHSLLKINFPLEEIELTSTSLLDTIFNGELDEEALND